MYSSCWPGFHLVDGTGNEMGRRGFLRAGQNFLVRIDQSTFNNVVAGPLSCFLSAKGANK